MTQLDRQLEKHHTSVVFQRLAQILPGGFCGSLLWTTSSQPKLSWIHSHQPKSCLWRYHCHQHKSTIFCFILPTPSGHLLVCLVFWTFLSQVAQFKEKVVLFCPCPLKREANTDLMTIVEGRLRFSVFYKITIDGVIMLVLLNWC